MCLAGAEALCSGQAHVTRLKHTKQPRKGTFRRSSEIRSLERTYCSLASNSGASRHEVFGTDAVRCPTDLQYTRQMPVTRQKEVWNLTPDFPFLRFILSRPDVKISWIWPNDANNATFVPLKLATLGKFPNFVTLSAALRLMPRNYRIEYDRTVL